MKTVLEGAGSSVLLASCVRLFLEAFQHFFELGLKNVLQFSANISSDKEKLMMNTLTLLRFRNLTVYPSTDRKNPLSTRHSVFLFVLHTDGTKFFSAQRVFGSPAKFRVG